jgi:ribonucleotide reductase beta subunit family protein with ferritin-like domain
MKNVSNGIDLVLIDESLHLKMGMEMIFAILQQSPEIMQDEVFVKRIQDTMVESVDLELQFLKQQFE